MKNVKRLLLAFTLVFAVVACVACGPEEEPTCPPHVDANHDCRCDICLELIEETHKPDTTNGCKCAICGYDFHNDQDYNNAHLEEGVCGACGRDLNKKNLSYAYVDPATCVHVDADSNCVCDACFTSMSHDFKTVNGKVVCSVCGGKKRDASQSNTYNTSFVTSPTVWNPHVYETADDGDVADFLISGLYGFYFNGDKSGYEIWPEMASAYPEDVTTSLTSAQKATFGVPTDATEHYAYKIRLNKNAKWEDGSLIKAADWVESFKLLMDPELNNYRAADQLSGSVVVANCEKYFNAGKAAKTDNGNVGYAFADLTKGEDGVYYAEDGSKVYIGWNFPLEWTSGDALKDYVDAYGDAYFDVTNVAALEALVNEDGLIELTDETYALFCPVTCNNPAWGETEDDVPNYFVLVKEYAAGYDFANVGIYEDPADEYAFYLVLAKPIYGFHFIYGLSSWLVKTDAYKAGISVDEITGVKTTNYNTSVETTHSYGPYMLSLLQIDKKIQFTRNPNWFGYTDERFDCLYHTSLIDEEYLPEASTRKEMFLKGELISYGLQSADYAQFGESDRYYVSPGSTLFFLILAANESVLKNIEDTKTDINKTILANADFRHAMSLAFNKTEFQQTASPARAPAFSVVGAYDIWNPTTGEKYRDTEIAKKAIVEFYGYVLGEDGKYHIEGSEKAYTLDEANDSITGYAPQVAKVLFDKAYDAWFEAGKIDENDVVEIEYCISSDSAFMTTCIDELNRQLTRTLEGTKLAGRVRIVKSTAYGNSWSSKIKSSEAQTVLGGWKGGMMDPFSSMLYYLEPNHSPYAAQWWKTEAVNLTLELPVGADGAVVKLTQSLANWSLALTGDTVQFTQEGSEAKVGYNFGYGQVSDEVRLTILATFEKTILGTDYYIPFMQDASGFLLSKKVEYALSREDYNAVMGRGGIGYMTYNYNDAEWKTYVDSQGGTLTY